MELHRSPSSQLTSYQQLALGREVLWQEAQALLLLSERMPKAFCQAVEVLLSCDGSVIVTGIGKAGLIGQKIAATLASTGTPAHFLHPAEAIHGDLGRISPRDVALVLSFSGETEEVVRLLPVLQEFRIPVVAITGRKQSTLSQQATVTVDLGHLQEACPLGLAPSTSTTAMLALGDAAALVVSRSKGFSIEDFYRYHPGGSLGRRLMRVEEVMRPAAECRIAEDSHTVREVLAAVRRAGRRTGAIMLIDHEGALSGIFTDSDLARLVEDRRDERLDRPICEVMTRHPKAVRCGVRLSEALELLAGRKLSELPVIDDAGRPCGLIDITDVVGLAPQSAPSQNAASQSTHKTQRAA